jgi:hypothetical protein
MPSTPPHAPWTSTYRLSSETRQQRILRAIHRLDHPGIKALGTTRDTDPVIVIECASAASEVRSRQMVMALDTDAVRTETTRAAGIAEAAVPKRSQRLWPSERLRRLL